MVVATRARLSRRGSKRRMDRARFVMAVGNHAAMRFALDHSQVAVFASVLQKLPIAQLQIEDPPHESAGKKREDADDGVSAPVGEINGA